MKSELRSDPQPRSRRFAMLSAFVVFAGLTALLAESSSQREGSALHSEVRAYMAATSDYSIPRPGDVPLAEAQLMTASAKVRQELAPNRQQVRRQARLDALKAIRAAYSDQLLAQDSIVGVGIAIPPRDLKPEEADWQLLILVAPEATHRDAAQALQASGIHSLLSDFGVRYESVQRPYLTAGERPGNTRVWAGVETAMTCRGVGTMGWLVQSRQADEVYVAGNATEQQSIGFMTVLHATAPGMTHNWENFQNTPREIEWTDFPVNCDAFYSAGRVIRLGPHAGVANFGAISQDIDFVSLYAERACEQAGPTENETEGYPTCTNFGTSVDGYEASLVPADPDDVGVLGGADAQICGGNTGQVRTGELDAMLVDFQLEVLDWSGSSLVPPVTITLQDTFRVMNPATDPAFSQAGDSGGPVWVLDDRLTGADKVWRPLGVQAGKDMNLAGTIVYSYITPLPGNLRDFDVELIFNNPRDPDGEFCSDCNCDCRTESFGVGPREGRLFLDTALATSPGGVRELTSLAIRHQEELTTLLEARGVEVYKSLFERDLAPFMRAAFNPPASRPKLSKKEVSSTLQILSWIHDSVRSRELQAEASKWFRFVAVYGEGRDFQELVRLYFLTSASTFETKIAAR